MYIVFFFRNFIEYFYVKYNQTSTIFKRDFNDLTYFEKLFLAFFYRNGIFKKSIANIYTNNSLLDFRKKKYPLIFFFHLYLDKSDYKLNSLKNLIKYYRFFNNSKIFRSTLNHFNLFFFKKKNKNNPNYKNNFFIFLIIQIFFFKRYYNLCSSIFFKTTSINNLVKLNWMFFIVLTKSNGFFYIYDLSKYTDWYNYNFKKNLIKIKPIDKKYSPSQEPKNSDAIEIEYKKKKINYLKKMYKHYNSFLKAFVIKFTYLSTLNLKFNKNVFKNILVLKLNSEWLKKLKVFYPVRFSETSMSKHINLENSSTYSFFYIRKNRIFNKGRYSRNRQLYRTGVYWCLWLNIMLVYGLYFMFYRFTFNFGYFWWGLLILAYSTIFSRIIKYNFFNVFFLKSEFLNLLSWFGLLINNFRLMFISIFNLFIKNLYFLKMFFFKKNIFILNFYSILLNFFILLKQSISINNSGKFIYFWESMVKKDESLFRYKSVIHWFTQLYKLLSY